MNWLENKIMKEKIKKYQIITFTFGLLLLNQLAVVLSIYLAGKEEFSEKLGLNIWLWIIGVVVIYFAQWLLVVWVATKFTRETLKQKFFEHPIATIILFISYVTDLPYRLVGYSESGIVSVFEVIVYYAFISFLWWLLVVWISSKIIKRQRFQWGWYKKTIEKVFVLTPVIYKIVLALVVVLMLFLIFFILMTVVFKYSGEDLKILFS